MSRRGSIISVQRVQGVVAVVLVAIAIVLAVVPAEDAAPEPAPAPLPHQTTAPAPQAPHARDDGLRVAGLAPARPARQALPCPAVAGACAPGLATS